MLTKRTTTLTKLFLLSTHSNTPTSSRHIGLGHTQYTAPTMASNPQPAVVHTPPLAPAKETENPPRRPDLTSEQFTKLATLLAHLNGPEFTLPTTVKDVKAAQKARLKRFGAKPEQWSGQPLVSGNKDEQLLPLSDVEKCFLSNERESCRVLDSSCH